jgi:hypothetical protein
MIYSRSIHLMVDQSKAASVSVHVVIAAAESLTDRNLQTDISQQVTSDSPSRLEFHDPLHLVSTALFGHLFVLSTRVLDLLGRLGSQHLVGCSKAVYQYTPDIVHDSESQGDQEVEIESLRIVLDKESRYEGAASRAKTWKE